jgi:hypothetical protein
LFNSTDYASQTYTFNYTVSDGCAVDQALATVNVHAAPSAGQDGTINVCLHEPFVLWNGLSGNIDMVGTWYNSSNTALAGAQDTAGNLAGSYNYDYIVTSQYCPNDSSNVLVIVDGSCDFTASVQELAWGVSIYPNPADQLITIETAQKGTIQLELLDMQGKSILNPIEFSVFTLLDVQQLPAGMYLIKLSADSGQHIERISIH